MHWQVRRKVVQERECSQEEYSAAVSVASDMGQSYRSTLGNDAEYVL